MMQNNNVHFKIYSDGILNTLYLCNTYMYRNLAILLTIALQSLRKLKHSKKTYQTLLRIF